MSFKNIIKQISNRSDIQNQPPVLIDIGASEEINRFWKPIAYFSVCLAFDADDRDFEYLDAQSSVFKRLVKVNKIVVDRVEGEVEKKDFYLTNSPYCSSLLEPYNEALGIYHFAPLFEVVDKKAIAVVGLQDVLNKTGLKYIDWLKTDSQGTDLRLLKSLNQDIQDQMLALELEPGFIDAYKGEDKIIDCLNYMETRKGFNLVEFVIKGPLQITPDKFVEVFKSDFAQKCAAHIVDPVPGWAEMCYFNNFRTSQAAPRDYILAWLFSTLKGHHEIAYVYASDAAEKFNNDHLFKTLKRHSHKELKRKLRSFGGFVKLVKFALNKYFGGNF